MHHKLYSSEGIVISRKNYGEADRILTIFSKNYGKIRVIAKGARRPKSRKRGHIEIFSRIKFQATSGEFGIITEADTIDSFSEIRTDLKRVSVAFYFLEIIQKIMHDQEENLSIYSLLNGFLTRLKTENGLKNLRADFAKRLLVLLGYWPVGQTLPNPDEKLEEVLERDLVSIKIGKKISS